LAATGKQYSLKLSSENYALENRFHERKERERIVQQQKYRHKPSGAA